MADVTQVDKLLARAHAIEACAALRMQCIFPKRFSVVRGHGSSTLRDATHMSSRAIRGHFSISSIDGPLI